MNPSRPLLMTIYMAYLISSTRKVHGRTAGWQAALAVCGSMVVCTLSGVCVVFALYCM